MKLAVRTLIWTDIVLGIANLAYLIVNLVRFDSVPVAMASICGLAAGFCIAGAAYRLSNELTWRAKTDLLVMDRNFWQEQSEKWQALAKLNHPQAFDEALKLYEQRSAVRKRLN